MKQLTPPLPWEKEWALLARKEARLVRRRRGEGPSKVGTLLDGKIPDTLQATLAAAFRKAFTLVWDRGDLLARTLAAPRRQADHQTRLYALGLRRDKQSLRAFSQEARRGRHRHLALAGAEGVGLGLLGIGLPDIPLFTGVLLRSLCQVALSYGYSWQEADEQRFLLKTLEVSLLRGPAFEEGNALLNRWIAGGIPPRPELAQLTNQAADALAAHLLYLKFVQGIPLAGVVGGLSDATCLQRVTQYADLKYHRRLLGQFRKI